MKTRGIALALALLAATGCGGGDEADASDTTAANEQSTTSTTERPTTSTTARPTTTTTTVPEVAVDFRSAAGFEYRLVLKGARTSPNKSTGGCVAVAPPGQTNLVLSLTLENGLTDRGAPGPNLLFDLNTTSDGTAVDPERTTIDDGDSDLVGELQPSTPLRPCSEGTPDARLLDLAAGGSVDLDLTFGPLPDPPPAGLVLLFRFYGFFDEYEDPQQDLSLPLDL